MKPVLDGRTREEILAQLTELAHAYTPEWRCDGATDDPGTALAELFSEMLYQTLDRMNSVPEKLRTEFLNLIGFQMPDPVPAAGTMQFTAHETVEAPVPVEAGTQVFLRDDRGEAVVYETERRVEATAARLEAVYFADSRAEVLQRLDLSRPQPFFTPTEGENLQRHRFSFGHREVLALSGPCEVEVEFRQQAEFLAAATAADLAERGVWGFSSDGETVPFDTVQAEGTTLRLTYRGTRACTPDASGRPAVSCTVPSGGTVSVDGLRLRSRRLDENAVDGAFCGDVPLDMENGDYCFGQRPAPYSLCYIQSDQAFCKRGAQVKLSLDIEPVVTDPNNGEPRYSFTQRIIDKRNAVTVVPDDVYVEQVVWEYFNGLGWRTLPVSGDRNPFSCQKAGRAEVRFTVPEDLEAAEVNAQTGYFIRVRVVRLRNEFTMHPRWIVPFLRELHGAWHYAESRPAAWCRAENNGGAVEIADTSGMDSLQMPLLAGLEEHPRSMYFQFDRSPHAMPLSLRFELTGSVRMDEELRVEAWTGKRFTPVRCLDLTRGLMHTGQMLLYLPQELPRHTLFGAEGCWVRLTRSSYQEPSGGYPCVSGLRLNTVRAVQRERAPELTVSVGVYEANKTVELPYGPVLTSEVWVDESSSLAVADAEQLARALPERVRLEWDDRVLTHCWVRWERVPELALAAPEERCYELDPYERQIAFGDGLHGKVPPAGEETLRIRYAYGGGSRGNCPAGAVTDLIGALPQISHVENLTPMSGGTDRFSAEQADRIGSKRLRNRGRAAGTTDFEEIVLQEFPQVAHVKCFSNRDGAGRYASGHVSVVVESRGGEDGRAAEDLCQRIYQALARCCDCVMTAEGRLHVLSSTVLTVDSRIAVELEDLDQSAATQQLLAQRLEALIDGAWRTREIGDQLRVNQVWQTVRDTPNVRLVRSVLLEGHYHQGGLPRVAALEEDHAFPYATVKSGHHLIQIGS